MRFYVLIFSFFVSTLYGSSLSVHLNPHFYADNTEFFNQYRVGQTYLGNDILPYVRYVSSENLFLNLGIYLNFYYGDDKISQILPISTLNYHLGQKFMFLMGTLQNDNRHNMLDALQSEERIYYKKIEYGFQLKENYKYFRSDSWINWNLLNTPTHREYFDFGNNMVWMYKIFQFNLQTYISHHGGQLYHTGAVRDNLSMALGLKIDYTMSHILFNGLGASFYYLTAKNVPDRNIPTLTTRGYGFLGEVYFAFLKFKIYCDYWQGNQFITEEGNPLYQTNKDYFFYGFKKEKIIKENTKFFIELRMHSIEDKFEYQYRFGFRSQFDFAI